MMTSFNELRQSLLARYKQLHQNPPTDAAYNAAVKVLVLLQNEAYQTAGDFLIALSPLMEAALSNKAESLRSHSPEWHEYWTILFGYLEYVSYELYEFSMGSRNCL